GFALMGPKRVETLARAKAAIRLPAVDEGLDLARVDLETLRLPVGAMWTTHVGSLVPVETEPAQSRQDRGLRRRGRPLLIGVFDAQDELAAVLASEGVVEQADVGRAHMGVARRARCDPHA